MARCSGLRPGVVRKVDHDGRRGAAYDHPSKRLLFRRIDFHVWQKGGNMNEIAGLRARGRFASFAPTDFTDAGENVGDCFLPSMIMKSLPRSRLHFERAAPDGRRAAEWRPAR